YGDKTMFRGQEANEVHGPDHVHCGRCGPHLIATAVPANMAALINMIYCRLFSVAIGRQLGRQTMEPWGTPVPGPDCGVGVEGCQRSVSPTERADWSF
ncbi:hypothetical protein J6590_042499, partial [Homalodisca vitripennis]